MARPREYADYIAELLSPLGPVSARSMFGGFGVYLDDLFFALIAEDTLYFKVDDETRPEFEALGSGPFKPYTDRPMTMQYYEVPAEILEDRVALLKWARKAVDVALRARAAKPAKRRKK